jgi:hypothetical protein
VRKLFPVGILIGGSYIAEEYFLNEKYERVSAIATGYIMGCQV